MSTSGVTMGLGLVLFGAALALLVGRELRRQRDADAGSATAWLIPPLLLGCGVVVVARFALLAYGN